MRYWWVNQNETYKEEVDGGYMWSPKRMKNGGRSQAYENMKEVAPGDLIFSYSDTFIAAVGYATSHAYESPRPEEFGAKGDRWSEVGWRVDVKYDKMTGRFRPIDHPMLIHPLLPDRYSPISKTSNRGNQGQYLCEISANLSDVLLEQLQSAGNNLPKQPVGQVGSETGQRRYLVREQIEEDQEQSLRQSPINETEKEQLVLARRGQGRFRRNITDRVCRVTGISNPEYLVASHIKPWRVATNEERKTLTM